MLFAENLQNNSSVLSVPRDTDPCNGPFEPTVQTTSKQIENPPSHSDEVKRLSHDPSLEGLRVLLIDDVPDNQVFVSRFLTLSGAHVELADNGEEGVEKALQNSCDIVIMDIHMPKLDGLSATALLREKGFVKPIIALTAVTRADERTRCLNAGFSEYLTKPIKRSVLLQCIWKLIKHDFPHLQP